MNLSRTERNRQLIAAAVGALLLVVMGGVLIAGFRLSTQMKASVAALESASTLRGYPGLVAQQIASLRNRLESRAYAGQALADLKGTVESFEADLQALAAADFGRSAQLDEAVLLWRQHDPVIKPVVAFQGQPYFDSYETGSTLSASGLAHYSDVKRAQLFARESSPRLQAALSGVANQLQTRAFAQASRLRLLLSAGVLAALVLAVAAAYLQLKRGRSERIAREAQEQTRDILKTVREGFFLLDADYRIGSVWSSALCRMFGRQDFSGLGFEELLRDRVAPATLATATKYIKLLWGDRAHENLMKSINPLGQLEIQIENAHGGRDTRYLQFDFHRVMGDKGVKHVLCSVSDITANVNLALELAEAQENASRQVDMFLGVMHIDPVQLVSFLDTTDTRLQHVNSIMRESARSDAEFRKKLHGLLTELHTVKGEASAVNLPSVAQRVHAIEDMVSDLKTRGELSGNDFLPMLLKLDELMAHLRSVRDLANRLFALQREQSPAPPQPPPAAPPAAGAGGQAAASELAKTLNSLAERLANEHGKDFKLALRGLADVPPAYRDLVRDVLIQMLRNAAVHGIEPAPARVLAAKSASGLIRFDFARAGASYELTCEDDGAGLEPETIKAAAVQKRFVTQQQAAGLDGRAILALIFKPGFSTQDKVTMDAGRGVGMDVVARSVNSVGGTIGVSTRPGRFTRFKIVLPAFEESSSAVA